MKECCKKYLHEQFGGDADVMSEIYGEYVSSMKAKIGEARTAIAEKQWVQLDRVAHTIKGNSLAAGDEEMANVAIELRGASKQEDEAMSASLIEKLEELYGLL